MRISDWSSDVCSSDLRLAEYGATQDVADRPVRRAVHALQIELLDPRLIGGDGGAFHADAVLLDGVGGIDGDPIVGFVAILNAEVIKIGRSSCRVRLCQYL